MPRLFAVQLKDGPAERYEQWVNTPVYTRDYKDCVGWLGCELPEDGHSCEFAVLAGDGAVTCASSSEVNRLRNENAKLKRAAERDADVMEALNLSLEESQAENAKLRKLIGRWYPHMRRRVGDDALRQWGHMDVMRELEIETGE